MGHWPKWIFPGLITSIMTASDMSRWGVIDQQLADLSCAGLTAEFVGLILHLFGHYSFLVFELAGISTCVCFSGSHLSKALCYLVNKELLHFKNTGLQYTKNKRQSSSLPMLTPQVLPAALRSGLRWSESLPATDHLKPSVCVQISIKPAGKQIKSRYLPSNESIQWGCMGEKAVMASLPNEFYDKYIWMNVQIELAAKITVCPVASWELIFL